LGKKEESSDLNNFRRAINTMFIFKYLRVILEGRGFFASFLVIAGWAYAFLIIGVLIFNIFLYIIGKKYYDDEFKNQVIKEVLESKDSLSVSDRYNINPEIVAKWRKKSEGGF
jgi:hypothetical protein